MTIQEDHPTVYERISVVEKELQSLATQVQDDDQARKLLLAVSQQAVNASEPGPDAIWRILMQVRMKISSKQNSSDTSCIDFHGHVMSIRLNVLYDSHTKVLA